MKRSFRMITLKRILSQICPRDWFMSLDLKDAYFHIQVAPHHRRLMRFAFKGVAYQHKVLPFGLSLAPRTFTRCMDTALSPLWRFQQGLGSTVQGQTDLRSLVRRGVGPAHQLPRNASSVSGLSILPARHSGTSCDSTLQQVCGVIHKSPGRPHLKATLHAGERPSCVGSDQSALTEDDACAGQNEPRSRHVKKQYFFRGMDAPPTRGSENLGSLWQSSSRPLRLWRQLLLPNLFYKEHGCPGPWMAQPSALCFPPSRSATTDTQASQGTMAQADSNSPPLEEPTVGVRVIPAAESSPVADLLDGTSSLKRMARYGIHGPSYGPCMSGHSTGAFLPPRACPKHYGRK